MGGSQAASTAVAVIVAVGAWQAVTVWSDGWVPSIAAIGAAVVERLADSSTYNGMAITARRIVIGFAGALVVGLATGLAMGISPWARALLRPVVVVGLAIPDPVTIILAILVIGTGEVAGLVGLTLAIAPFGIVIVAGAVESRDPHLDELARVYRFSRRHRLVDVLARQVAPGLLASARSLFAFSWKVVVLVEAISQPRGVGAQIYTAFRLLRPADMIALALLFILVMRLAELTIFRPAERRLLAWNRP